MKNQQKHVKATHDMMERFKGNRDSWLGITTAVLNPKPVVGSPTRAGGTQPVVEWGSAVEPRRWGVYRAISKPGDVVVTIETRTKLNADSLSLRMDPDRYKDAASEVRSSLVTRLGSLPVRLAVVVCGGGYDWANQNTNSPPKKKKSGATDGGVGGAYAAPEARIGAFEVQVAFMSREKVPRAQPRGFRAGEGEEQQFDHVDTLHYEHLFSKLQACAWTRPPEALEGTAEWRQPPCWPNADRLADKVASLLASRGLHPSEDDGRMGGPDPELLGDIND